jgi:glycosyl transferase family 87
VRACSARAVAVTVRGDRLSSRPRVSTWLVLALLMAGTAPWVLFARDLFLSRNWISGDFVAFFAGARLVADGTGSQLYQLASVAAVERGAVGHGVGGSGVLPYFNPPFFAWLLEPLAGLSLQSAYRVWSLFSLAWLAVDAWLLWKIARPLSGEWKRVLVVAFLVSLPVTFGLRQGQFSLILEGSWSAAFLLLRSRRTGWAGVALAPMLIKPELLIPIACLFIWKREWRSLLTLSACALGAVALSVVTVGVPSARGYPDFLLDSTTWSSNGNTPALMFGWNGLLAASAPMGVAARQGVAAALGVASLGLASYAWGSSRVGPGRLFGERWLVLTLATMLIDQHFYFQDTVLLVPGIVAVLAYGRPGERLWLAAVAAVAWLVASLATYPNETWHIDLFATLAVLALIALVSRHRVRVRHVRQRRVGAVPTAA